MKRKKRRERELVCEAINAVGSEQRTHTEVKKKWSDLEVEVKRRVSAHHRSVTTTGRGTGVEELPFDKRVASLVGDTALTGVMGAHEGDTDHPQDDKPGEDSSAGVSTAAADVCLTGRVLTRAVLESQEEMVRAIGGINDCLDQLIHVVQDPWSSVPQRKHLLLHMEYCPYAYGREDDPLEDPTRPRRASVSTWHWRASSNTSLHVEGCGASAAGKGVETAQESSTR
ncbi:uncharacterized protein LOC113745873 [Larimichthys crocea]|uniref:uncharacterized protein LOC113745873 n=1 Tax=Larimichthys crocea TaxID=215358 RepID=UPI000F5E292C|nr:uncharacterized protein LOC113745873 [Larimichthys crocea]